MSAEPLTVAPLWFSLRLAPFPVASPIPALEGCLPGVLAELTESAHPLPSCTTFLLSFPFLAASQVPPRSEALESRGSFCQGMPNSSTFLLCVPCS